MAFCKEPLDLTCLFDKPIAFHRCFAEIAGSAAGGLFLSQLVYWDKVAEKMKDREDNSFFKSQDEWKEETALTRREQETSRKKLKLLGILEETRKGTPARLWFRLNREALNRELEKLITKESDAPPPKTQKNTAATPDISKNVTSDIQECQEQADTAKNPKKTPEAPDISKNVTSDKLESHILQTRKPDVTDIQRIPTETTDKTTTTTHARKSKMELKVFIGRIEEAMKISPVPIWFAREVAAEIWEEYSHPRTAHAMKIIYDDWQELAKKKNLNTLY